MHESGGPERLAGQFLGQLGCGELVKFLIDQGRELCRRPGIAVLNTGQDAGDLAHKGGCYSLEEQCGRTKKRSAARLRQGLCRHPVLWPVVVP